MHRTTIHRAPSLRWMMGAVAGMIMAAGGCTSSPSGRGGEDATTQDASTPGSDAAPADDAAPPDDATPPDDDACVPALCAPETCGILPDGCGGDLDCGGCDNLGETCEGSGVPNTCGAANTILHAEPGCFLDMVDVNSSWEVDVGGTDTYAWIAIEYDTVHGGWRTDLYSREVLNHGLFGFTRNAATFPERYILGNAAQIHPAHPTLDRKSVFYGRVDLETKPPGEGWTGYTSWRDPYPWTPGETYHVRIVLDAVAQEQILEIYHGGVLDLSRVGPIPYFDPTLTAVVWTATFGGEESADREVKPLGWQFCNLLIEADEL